jgi:phospholipid/cholesterol/gamma-HCH transport system substrate-binding protein
MLARSALGAVAILVLGAFGIALFTGPIRFETSDGHRLVAVVPEAANVLAGQELKAGGGKIGRIERLEAVEGGRRAKLTLRVEDRAWPLPQGTRFTIRWGGTASFSNRHVLVTPGPAGNPPLADGATIPARDFVAPVEVDQLLATFDAKARRDLKSFVNRSGVALDRSRGELRAVLQRAPGAVDQAAHVMGDVVADRSALDVAVRKADRVVDAVRRADPELGRLVQGAAGTFDAIADKQGRLRTTLQRLPAALEQTQRTLGRADGTLTRAGALARRLGPGGKELRAAAGPVDDVLASVQSIAPDARSTLATVRQATPDLNALLQRATTLAPQLGSLGDGAVENLQCIRPWTPEIVGLLMTWGDFMSWNDRNDKVLRATVQNFLPANFNSVPYTPAQAKKLYPQLRYGFPRPPGYLAGQPWYQPQCGAGPDAVDPSKDKEAGKPLPITGEKRR